MCEFWLRIFSTQPFFPTMMAEKNPTIIAADMMLEKAKLHLEAQARAMAEPMNPNNRSV